MTHATFKRNPMIYGDSPNWILYSTITGYFSRPYKQLGKKKKNYLPRAAKY
jgi:hypothetical protein